MLECTLDIKFNTFSGAKYSVVVVATRYGPDGPGFELRWGRFSGPIQIGPEAHPASCTMCNGSLYRRQNARSVALATKLRLAPGSGVGRAIPLPPLRVSLAC